jgi:uncharacterized protein (DUF608 family)
MSELLDTLAAELDKLNLTDYKRTDDSIVVQAHGNDGFSVHLWGDHRREFIVNYGHYWHGHFETETEAADWFLAGATGWARLVCTYHWRYLVKSTVELWLDDNWTRADTTGSCLGLFVFWLPKRIRTFKNTQIGKSQQNG